MRSDSSNPPASDAPGPDEAFVAAWLQQLDPAEAHPAYDHAALRRRVLARWDAEQAETLRAAEAVGSSPQPSWFSRWWGAASFAAAAAVFALVLLTLPAERAAGPTGDAPALAASTPASDLHAVDFSIVEDPGLPLLHGLETFEGADIQPGELIAGLGVR